MIEDSLETVPSQIEDFYGMEIYSSNSEYFEDCPECGMQMVTTTGRCKTCQFCGWSACSM